MTMAKPGLAVLAVVLACVCCPPGGVCYPLGTGHVCGVSGPSK